MTQVAAVFEHIPHPHTRAMLAGSAPAPPKVDDERIGFNGKLGLFLTTIVGTMWAAYLFVLIALVSFPQAVQAFLHGDTFVGIAWLSQSFLQLVLLPIIIVGQNVISASQDARAEADHLTLTTLHAINVQQLKLLEQQRETLQRQREILDLLREAEVPPPAPKPDL